MLFSKTAIVLALLPFTIAATCSSSDALPWPLSVDSPSGTSSASSSASTGGTSSGGSGSSSSSSTSQASVDAAFTKCTNGCDSDSTCLVGCLSTACTTHCGSSTSSCQSDCISDPCSAFYGSGSSEPNEDALQACYETRSAGQCNSVGCPRQLLRPRATLTCTSSETCYIDPNDTLVCIDMSTGEYNDETGGTGNFFSGNSAATGTGVSAATATGSRVGQATSGASSLVVDSQTTPTGSSGAATTNNSNSNAGVSNFRGNAVLGAVGLLLGLVL